MNESLPPQAPAPAPLPPAPPRRGGVWLTVAFVLLAACATAGAPYLQRELAARFATLRDHPALTAAVIALLLLAAFLGTSLVWRQYLFTALRQELAARRQMEAALRESEQRYRLLLEHSLDAILLTVPDGPILQANRAACAMFGFTEAELCQLGRSAVVCEDDPRLQAALAERSRTGRFVGELTLRRRYGARFSGEVSSIVFHDPEGRPRTSMIIRDLTERKRLEQERAAIEAQLRQQQRLESIGTLAGGIAHEINNPINGIMNYAQLIQDRLPGVSPLREFTGEILRETQRVATIVRNLLTFSRNEKQSHSPARLVDIVEGTLSLIRTIIRHDGITLEVNVPEHLPQLKCRTQQIQQVIMNLMTNARDALNERHPEAHPDKLMRLSALLVSAGGHQWIRLTVEDQGVGLAPAVRERMFDPFFTTKPRDKGTGLGLAISHSIVKEHGGNLSVESEPGRFTRLHLDLPLVPAAV